MVRKIVGVLLAVGISVVCAGCGGDTYTLPAEFTAKTYTDDNVAAYEGKSPASGLDESSRYLQVDGVPMLMLGGQLRTDFFMQLENKSIDDLDEYFKLARRLNITVVQVPICWADIEKTKDAYDNTYVEKYIRYAEKYDLKLELLWFGSYMCGVSVAYGYVPEYIFADTETYEALNPYLYSGWLGKTYLLSPAGDNLLRRERAAIGFMMDGIYEYDRMHGGRHTVVGVQIENEPDMLLTTHTDSFGEEFNVDTVRNNLVKHLDEMGKIVKASDYRCYTRVNLTVSGETDFFTKALAESEGIDFVGLDPYTNKLNAISSHLDALAAHSGNFPHIAENGGEFENNDQMELLAFTKGCGYEVFEVVTTIDPQLADWELRGVFNTDFSKKPHTQRLIDANKIYRDGFLDIVLAEKGCLLGFNLATNGGANSATQTLSAGGISVTHSTSSRGIAYAAVRDKVITVASTKDDTFTFDAKVLYVEKGYYSTDGVWHREETVKVKKNTLNAQATAVYRVLVA